jgi:rhodanese-related sulfurtransferase
VDFSRIQIIDVREPAEFESEHIDGALSLPLSTIGQDTIKILFRALIFPVFFLAHDSGQPSHSSILKSKSVTLYLGDALTGFETDKEGKITVLSKSTESFKAALRLFMGRIPANRITQD